MQLFKSNLRIVLILGFLSSVNALYSKYDSVKELDPASFKKVMKDDGIWIVEFYAPWCGHCRNLAPEWKKAAKALAGVVNIAAVDADQHKSLAGKYGVQGFPTIKIFGQDKTKPRDYQGQRSAKDIVEAGLTEARKLVRERLNGGKSKSKQKSKSGNKGGSKSGSSSSDVITLTDDNFDDLVLQSGHTWFVEFYAPWCGHCKALAPEWEQAATELKGSVKIGALDATVHKQKASEYGIQGFPTIKVFNPKANSPNDAIDYRGERKSSAIVNYGFQMFEKYGGSTLLPEITSEDVLNDQCSGKSICVVAFLPHILNSMKKGREGYLNSLTEVRKTVRGLPLRFGWIQESDQTQWENTFGLTFGFPSLVALNLQKNRFAVQKGSFTIDSIKSFLEGLTSGREKTSPYDKLPPLNKVTPWDGEEGKVPGGESDDDDDDIMKEILGSNDKDEL